MDLIGEQKWFQLWEEGLAELWIAFCEGLLQCETERILEAGARYGLRPEDSRQWTGSFRRDTGRGRSITPARWITWSLPKMQRSGIKRKCNYTCLIARAAFFLGMKYPPARKMMNSGLPVALASDYNRDRLHRANMKFISPWLPLSWSLLPKRLSMQQPSTACHGISDSHSSIGKGKACQCCL